MRAPKEKALALGLRDDAWLPILEGTAYTPGPGVSAVGPFTFNRCPNVGARPSGATVPPLNVEHISNHNAKAVALLTILTLRVVSARAWTCGPWDAITGATAIAKRRGASTVTNDAISNIIRPRSRTRSLNGSIGQATSQHRPAVCWLRRVGLWSERTGHLVRPWTRCITRRMLQTFPNTERGCTTRTSRRQLIGPGCRR